MLAIIVAVKMYLLDYRLQGIIDLWPQLLLSEVHSCVCPEAASPTACFIQPVRNVVWTLR